MRQSTSTSSPINTNKQTPSPTISSSAALAITMVNTTQSKRRHAMKYRPIERSDGVVTVYPPYQPSTTPPRPELKFEPKPLTLPTQPPPTPNKATNFCAIGVQFMYNRGQGYNTAVVECGRGGYNRPLDAHRLGAQRDREARGLMMERFLAEETGPWSAYSLRAR